MDQFGRVAELPVVEGAYITLRTANPATSGQQPEGEEDPFRHQSTAVPIPI